MSTSDLAPNIMETAFYGFIVPRTQQQCISTAAEPGMRTQNGRFWVECLTHHANRAIPQPLIECQHLRI